MKSSITLIKTWARQPREWLPTTEARLFFLVWFIYAIHVVPGGGVNPNRYFDLIHSLVNERVIHIDSYHENTIDKAFKDGHYYSAGLPGPSLLGIPSYLAFKALYVMVPDAVLKSLSSVQSYKQGTIDGFYARDNTDFFLSTIWITWFTLSFLSALASIFLFRFLQDVGIARIYALSTTLLYAFGTLIFFYSTTYFSHAFEATLAIFVLFAIVRAKPYPSSRWLVGLGLLSGSAFLVEYQGFIIAGGIGFYVFRKWGVRSLIPFALGASVVLAILFAYNTIAFGGPFHVPQEFLAGTNRERSHGSGLLGFAPPSPDRLIGLLVLPDRGLFWYSPILLLGIVGIGLALYSKKKLTFELSVLAAIVIVGVFLFDASFADWKAGAAFGPRYLIASFPFMMIGVAMVLPRIPKWISIPLATWSILTNWLGAQFGFAQDIFEPWQTLFQQGFTLPATSALISHSRGANSFTMFLSNLGWTITLLYASAIIVALVWLFASLRRSDAALTLNATPADSA